MSTFPPCLSCQGCSSFFCWFTPIKRIEHKNQGQHAQHKGNQDRQKLHHRTSRLLLLLLLACIKMGSSSASSLSSRARKRSNSCSSPSNDSASAVAESPTLPEPLTGDTLYQSLNTKKSKIKPPSSRKIGTSHASMEKPCHCGDHTI